MFNQYSVILVNRIKHGNVKKQLGLQFIDSIRSRKIESPRCLVVM